MTEAIPQACDRQYWEDKKLTDQTAKNTEFNKNTTSDQADNGQASPSSSSKDVPRSPGMTEELRQARLREYWEEKKLADQTAKNTEFDKNTTTSDQANNGQASPPSRKAVPSPPGMTEAIPQACDRQYWEDKKLTDQTAKNTEFQKNTTSDQANNGQASPSSRRTRGVPMPPGMTLEIREANIRQYWEEKKLYDQTAKNTEFNKNITISGQANHGQASPPSSKRKGVSVSPNMTEEARQVCNKQYWEDKKLADQTPRFNKHIKWADLSHPI